MTMKYLYMALVSVLCTTSLFGMEGASKKSKPVDSSQAEHLRTTWEITFIVINTKLNDLDKALSSVNPDQLKGKVQKAEKVFRIPDDVKEPAKVAELFMQAFKGGTEIPATVTIKDCNAYEPVKAFLMTAKYLLTQNEPILSTYGFNQIDAFVNYLEQQMDLSDSEMAEEKRTALDDCKTTVNKLIRVLKELKQKIG